MSKSDLVASLGSSTFKSGDEIVINFSDGVISTGGQIEIKNSKNGKLVEKFEVGSETIKAGIYSFDGILFDYEYNNIAILNDDFFPNLAASNNISVSDKSNDAWANDLRLFWNLSIDGKLFALSDNGWDFQADDDYSYHSTTPEYTPGADNFGMSHFVLSPFGGTRQLTIKPMSLKVNKSYEVDLSNAGLLSAADDLYADLKFDSPLSFKLTKTKNADKAVVPDEIAEEATSLIGEGGLGGLRDNLLLDLLLSATRGTLASSKAKDNVDRIRGLNAFFDAGIPEYMVDIAFTKRGINVFANLAGSKYEDERGQIDTNLSSVVHYGKPQTDDPITRLTKFKTKFAYKLTSFDPSKDNISIDINSFDIDGLITFKAGKNSKFIKKKLARKDFDFLYDEKKGGLYFNENGADKGFGDGGIIAILKGAPGLTAGNLDFI